MRSRTRGSAALTLGLTIPSLPKADGLVILVSRHNLGSHDQKEDEGELVLFISSPSSRPISYEYKPIPVQISLLTSRDIILAAMRAERRTHLGVRLLLFLIIKSEHPLTHHPLHAHHFTPKTATFQYF